MDLVAHNAVISAAVRSLKPSGHPAVGAVQGRSLGSDVRPKDTMRNEPGMVSWCPAVQQREGGMPKAADICHKQPNTHCKNSNSGHASTLMKT